MTSRGVGNQVRLGEEARRLVSRLGESIHFYKVGMELYAAAGMPFVRELIAGGKDVFLDMKFYDIPETVKRAVAQVAGTGVRFLTVHGSGPVMRAAVGARGGSPRAAAADRKRVAPPAEAIRNGADYLVMGRQITRAPDPAAEVARVLEEIAA